MKIKFLGAAGFVTGSCYLLTFGEKEILVDLGLFQGADESFERNNSILNFDPKKIDTVILTHAHVDHSGRIPLLTKGGFNGVILSTLPTRDLTEILLLDSARVQGNDFRKGNITEVLYTENDVPAVMSKFKTLRYKEKYDVSKDISVTLYDAGHILGAASIEIRYIENNTEKTIVFSGDLGCHEQKLMNSPSIFTKANYVVMESTYGNRVHPKRKDAVENLHYQLGMGGRFNKKVLIPSFSVERTQELLYELNSFYEKGEFKDFPVFFDSPLALKVNYIYSLYSDLLNTDYQKLSKKGDNPLDFSNLTLVHRTEGVHDDLERNGGIVISGSGMCNGGRIVGYIKRYIEDPDTLILILGFQAKGTLGREILDGNSPINIEGYDYQINAKVIDLQGFSAHADKDDLFEWLSHFETNLLQKVFVTHGEKTVSEDFADRIEKEMQIKSVVPEYGQVIELD